MYKSAVWKKNTSYDEFCFKQMKYLVPKLDYRRCYNIKIQKTSNLQKCKRNLTCFQNIHSISNQPI